MGEDNRAGLEVRQLGATGDVDFSGLRDALNGNERVFVEIVGQFIEMSYQSIAEIFLAIENDDAVRVAALAHSILGASGLLGVVSYGALAEELKAAASCADLDLAEKLTIRLRATTDFISLKLAELKIKESER